MPWYVKRYSGAQEGWADNKLAGLRDYMFTIVIGVFDIHLEERREQIYSQQIVSERIQTQRLHVHHRRMLACT